MLALHMSVLQMYVSIAYNLYVPYTFIYLSEPI